MEDLMKKLGSLILTSAIILSIYSATPAFAQLKGPNLKIRKTVHGIRKFKNFKISPNNYILSRSMDYKPVIYDMNSNKIITIGAIEKLSGLPPLINTRGMDRYQRSKLTVEGKLWRWRTKNIVYYNGETGNAGVFLDKSQKVKFGTSNPPCPGGGASEYIQKYGRYYCRNSRKYIKEKDYLKTVRKQYYAKMDTNSKRIVWMSPLERNWNHRNEQPGVQPIGVDPSGDNFYYSNSIHFYKKTATSGHIIIHRFNISERRVDWKYEFKIPVRRKGSTAPSYGVRCFHSNDFSKLVFLEYDEAPHGKKTGYLKNPQAMAYVVDTSTRSHIALKIPVTSYGRLIDRENKYLIIGSNQTGYLYKYDLSSGKVLKKVYSGVHIYQLLLSRSSKYLYSMNKKYVDVRSWKDLRRVKKIPNSRIFPGVTVLLSTEGVIPSNNGNHAIIGILKKGKRGPWASSVFDDGFHILEIGD